MGGSYWKCVWIIQELAANNLTQVIICGRQEIPTQLFFLAIDALGDNYLRVGQCIMSLFDSQNSSGVQKDTYYKCHSDIYQLLVLARSSLTLSPEKMTPLALRLSRSAEQSDVRDKVYGILSLLDPRIVAEIKPDYKLSVSEVLISFCKAVITSTDSLELLRRAGVSSVGASGRLPSWVEDLASGVQDLKRETAALTYHGEYFAGVPMPSYVEFSEQGADMLCLGVIVDTVDDEHTICGAVRSSRVSTYHKFQQVCECIQF
jgi:hypothetical protein